MLLSVQVIEDNAPRHYAVTQISMQARSSDAAADAMVDTGGYSDVVLIVSGELRSRGRH